MGRRRDNRGMGIKSTFLIEVTNHKGVQLVIREAVVCVVLTRRTGLEVEKDSNSMLAPITRGEEARTVAGASSLFS